MEEKSTELNIRDVKFASGIKIIILLLFFLPIHRRMLALYTQYFPEEPTTLAILEQCLTN